jgi:hypothetical protein
VKNSPYNQTVHKVPQPAINEPERIAVTWRQYQKKGLSKKRAPQVQSARPAK